MPEAHRTSVLLLLVFVFSFIFRMLLMFWAGYPPGADIGLHNSVIHSITGGGGVDFLYNFYHIGGGVSLTFPGYHIFTAGVIMLTGLPEYVAQAAVVAFFSSLIVLCAFLITKRVWSLSAGLLVAFLAAISRFDIEMLMWAGYPNVITLMLIPLTFYLYLEKDRFTKTPFLASTSILAASLFLTHSLSAAMFGLTAAVTILIVLALPSRFRVPRKTALYWFAPIVFGAALVSPFLISAVPTYLAEYGSDEIAAATVATRIQPLEVVLPLFLITAAFFIFSKKFYNKFLTLPTLLFAMWVFLPLILTQGYLVGLPVDYNRFLYFLVLPVLVFIAVLLDYGSGFFAETLDKLRTEGKLQVRPVKVPKRLEEFQRKTMLASKRISAALTRKRIYTVFAAFFLIFCFAVLPIFTAPSINVGQTLQSYYQTMNTPKWEAMQWLKQNTSEGSVLVADALYGWWLGGFTQRPTLSAVDPAYLTVKREVDNASFASKLLDTDYIIDNGYIQVREDGYVSRHNPEIVAKQNWTYNPYSFFTFNNNGTSIEYQVNGVQAQVWVNNLTIKDIHMLNDTEHTSIIVTRGNDDLNYTLTTTVCRDTRFVNITATLTSLVEGVVFDYIHMTVETNGVQVSYGNDLATIGLVDLGTKSFGQLIFSTPPQTCYIPTEDIVKIIQLTYPMALKSEGQFQLLAGAYSESNNPDYYANQEAIDNYFLPIVSSNLNTAMNRMQKDHGWSNFDYHTELVSRKISYVVLSISDDPNPDKTELDVEAKFRYDPAFSLVFINEEVAIYKVNG